MVGPRVRKTSWKDEEPREVIHLRTRQTRAKLGGMILGIEFTALVTRKLQTM